MVYLFYTTYISVDLAHHEIFHAKVGKGGIICFISSLASKLVYFNPYQNAVNMS